MFSYEFQKQLVVSAGAIFIYVIAVYTILDCANMVIKEIYKLGKNASEFVKEHFTWDVAEKEFKKPLPLKFS